MNDRGSSRARAPRTRTSRKPGWRWLSWLFGAALLIALGTFVVARSERQELAHLVTRGRPAWLLLGVVFQLGTYLADARILQVTLRRASISRSLGSYMGLGLAKLFIDHTMPTGGVTGTLLMVRALDRRNVKRKASMAGVVVNLVSHYAAHSLAVVIGLVIAWTHGGRLRVFVTMAAAFALLALAIPAVLLEVSRGSRKPPRWAQRIPVARSLLGNLARADPEIAHDAKLIAHCTGLQFAVIALDAATLWAMLIAFGQRVNPALVFASFVFSTLARILGVVPGGLGIFEAASVAALRLTGVSVTVGLAATLLFRALSFWLPMLPGTLFARRETRAAASAA